MNKTVKISVQILCLSFLLFLMNCEAPAKAAQSAIDVPGQYRTIQEAINHANPGDTVFVHNGTYLEHLVIDRSVFLVGENMDSTIIDGAGTGSVISITASNVVVKGFTVRNSGIYPYDSGIRIDHSSSNVIQNNKITSNYDGVGLYYSNDNRVLGNLILNNFEGVGLYFSTNNLVSGNNVTNNTYDGIGLYDSSDNIASENTISKNFDGLRLYYLSNNNTIFHNNFNNTNQVRTDSVNVWSYELEGNYWTNVTNQDSNGDGIGDFPYVINAKNQDNHPLLGRFSSFDVTTNKATYHVALISNSTISGFKSEIGTETGNQILRFNATGDDGTVGFNRVTIPTQFMDTPYVVIVGGQKITPTAINTSSDAYACLYFTYNHSQAIRIISSDSLTLISELLSQNSRLWSDIAELNATYGSLLSNYTAILENNSQLQNDFNALNAKYLDLWNRFADLLGNYSQLQGAHNTLNSSYQEHLQNYDGNVQNLQNLIYIFAATTAIFMVTTIYLSRSTHSATAKKTATFEDRE